MTEKNKPKRKTKPKMKKKTSLTEKIVKLLKERRGRPMTQKELSHALLIHKEDYPEFQDALHKLLSAKKIVKLKGRRYTLPSSLQLVQGTIQLTRKGFGFVTDERTGEEIFIAAQHLNTALNGDKVEVRLFAVSRGKSKEGQVVRILERARKTFVGTYHRSEYYGFVVPDDPRVYRDFYVQPQNSLKAKDGQKVVVEFLKWDKSTLNPEGRIVEILGYPGDPGVDVASVAKGFELPLAFPEKVEREAQRIRMKITPELLAERLDLRDELIFTIDPEDAKDFDDAVSLTKLENGLYRLGVHIADVTHYVPENSVLDREALKRGTSVYLVDRVVPMLPEHLSNEICSLQPDVPRLTFSCIMDINSEGEVVNYQIKPSVIHSKRRFNYQEVQRIIDDPKSKDPHAGILREMRDFSQMLKAKRIARGSIDFDTPEVKFILDEQGKPVEIVPVERLQSHELIEEFMLMANQTVARHVQRISGKGKPRPFIYRVHERPDSEKLDKFQQFLNALGYRVKVPHNLTPKQFQEILKKVSGKDDLLIKEVALRTMMKAVYSTKNIGHFGLGFEDYTHFTSPIRRYPDLEVHRLLKEYAGKVPQKRLQFLKTELKNIAEQSSARERVALEAERESVKIKQVEWIADYEGKTFNGLISGVTAYGLFVEIVPYLIEGLVRVEDLDDDYYIYDEKTFSMVGQENGRVFRLGDEVTILVFRVNREANQVDFRLVSDENEPKNSE